MSLTTEETDSTSCQDTCTAFPESRAARRPSAPARAPGVAADEDLHHLWRGAVDASDLEIVDLAAVLPVGVDELVVEDAERDVDLGAILPLIPVLRSSAA